MGKSLTEIAEELKGNDKKVQLIYAFNGTGKTRLSREFKNLIAPTSSEEPDGEPTRRKFLYYNAFTEDLFFWDNDLLANEAPRLKIQKNSFTDWLLRDNGLDGAVIKNFQYYTDDKLTPDFNDDFSEIAFYFARGNDEQIENIKISKGEESNFIWSIFYVLIRQVIAELNIPEDSEEGRSTDQFDDLEYIFIDDPVSSLDENHLIQQAVDLADLIKLSKPRLKFIITTHNVLFYNVLYNELKKLEKEKKSYLLLKNEDGSFDILEKQGDFNKSFSYHLHLKGVIEKAIENQQVERFHFMLLRNLYEKTANFLGYKQRSDILPEDSRRNYFQRIINFTSHSTLSNEAFAEPTPQEQETVKLLLQHLLDNYNFFQDDEQRDKP
ncbi:AAA family ATPase [Neisseria meningitidis]|nr:anticodon nuclease [Neisseria meningitidis]MBG8839521.1 AAA family ATPase [Neisseria meningitidis]MBG8850197.1 AAA family ATPase [Neisseria meningitidis]MBG9191473.1 AAA family ATPase [Neisseria meningitidis]MBG9208243.1 AAA family ATPase [Neisseria meningitidis]